jgi:catechol 2,3-dioxygenase-like lactoylglutathione lyase family enzyme
MPPPHVTGLSSKGTARDERYDHDRGQGVRPARDFALSKRFYQDLGFDLAWSSEDLAYLRHGNSSFLLQNFYNKDHAGNFMMHLLVEDVDAWWRHVQTQGMAAKYAVKVEPPADRPWGMRDFVIVDPTGVLWRIGQNNVKSE